ncbi:MAG: DNA-deoxyinosine glycosylase [Clostridiales bacterium]|nr:DNA-deoxyinosine glycosylase [Clostridiales bacterium]
MSNNMIDGFNPVFSKESKVLILGSFPSVPSRAEGFYYGNKRNRFWSTLAKIYKTQKPETVEEKTDFIIANKLALWDIVVSCDIVGSKDEDLKNYKVANLNEILSQSKIDTVICNGKKCYEIYSSNYRLPVKVYQLPSTSPANVSFDEDKWIEVFKEILNG